MATIEEQKKYLIDRQKRKGYSDQDALLYANEIMQQSAPEQEVDIESGNNILKTLLQNAGSALVTRPVSRATEAVTRLAFPGSQAAQGYEQMADAGESQNILGTEVKAVKAFDQGGGSQLVGETLESASYLPFGRAIGTTGKLLTNPTARGLVQISGESAIGAGLDSAGRQLQDDGTVDPFRTAGDTIIGGAFGLGLGVAGTTAGRAYRASGRGITSLADMIKSSKVGSGVSESGLTKKEIVAGIRPDIKKSIAGQEKGIQEYFDVTRKRLEDETAITPTGLLTQKAENAFKKVEDILEDTGKGIGAKRKTLGSYKASNEEAKSLIDTFNSEIESLGLLKTKNGVKRGSGIVDVSDTELKLIEYLQRDLLKVSGDPKVSTIQKAISKFRNRVNFGKSSSEVSGVMDGLLKKISSQASKVNKNILGEEAASQYAKYSEIKEFLKETKNIRNNPQVILRRILSSDSSKGLDFAKTIKELTGTDLIKESRFAKLAVDTFGDVNPELGTRFRQQLTDSGVDANKIVGAISSTGGATIELIRAIAKIPSSIKRELLLRKGINPAQVDAEELAKIILDSARGSEKEALNLVEDLIN